jgi:polysaccharide export outer membrane protein
MKIVNSKLVLLFLGVIFLLSSCVPYKELRYFNDIKKLESKTIKNERTQKKITPFDYIYIKVLSTDEKTAAIFNTADDFRGSNGVNSLMGYGVDDKGNIHFPFVGDIKVAGYTTFEASEVIHKALSEYISNTSIIVKFIDNKVTVLGEVQRQGIFQFNDDKITIYQALALADGLTRFGSRKNIVLMRQEGINVVYHKIDLSDSKIAESDLYYILPNDLIIVEPLRSVSWNYQNVTYTTILASITTLVTMILAIRTLKN